MQQSKPKIEWKCRWNQEKKNLGSKKWQFSDFWAEKKVRAEGKRSRAETKILQLELWLEPARLGLITSRHTSIQRSGQLSEKYPRKVYVWACTSSNSKYVSTCILSWTFSKYIVSCSTVFFGESKMYFYFFHESDFL